MAFAISIISKEPKNHIQDCYFCLVNVKRFSSKCKSKIAFPDLDSARRPVPHDASMPVPLPHY